jgi:hypothetical protein
VLEMPPSAVLEKARLRAGGEISSSLCGEAFR